MRWSQTAPPSTHSAQEHCSQHVLAPPAKTWKNLGLRIPKISPFWAAQPTCALPYGPAPTGAQPRFRRRAPPSPATYICVQARVPLASLMTELWTCPASYRELILTCCHFCNSRSRAGGAVGPRFHGDCVPSRLLGCGRAREVGVSQKKCFCCQSKLVSVLGPKSELGRTQSATAS